MDVGKVRAALRPGLADRLAAVRVREGAISLVVEGTGLDAAARGYDVEQALCEFSKYEAYRTRGVSSSKRFRFIPRWQTK
mgnify:CR=1 FL=1